MSLISLIKNELKKVFKRKLLWILFIIVFLFILLNFVMDKRYSATSFYNSFREEEINFYRDEIKNLDSERYEDKENYVYYKTNIDIYELEQNYPDDSWQRYIISEYLFNVIEKMNRAKYINNNQSDYDTAKEEYDNYINYFENDDWIFFANKDLEDLSNEKKEQEEYLKTIVDKRIISDTNKTIESINIKLENVRMRLDKNIKYGYDYLNSAMDIVLSSKMDILNYKYLDNPTNDDRLTYQNSKEQLAKNEYIIENKIDLNQVSLRSELIGLHALMSLFLIITVTVIGGTIVSEEFNKGTIKLLLIKPYERWKILLSKFITMLLIIVFMIAFIYVVYLLLGGIMFGFSSLNIPELYYNYNTDSLVAIHPLLASFLNLACILPEIILLGILAFSLGTIFNISALAIALPLGGTIAADIINSLAIYKDIKILRYFVTLNWDFSWYLFGKTSQFKYTNFGFSAVVCIIYALIMIIASFFVFKKKNIKNI